MKLIKQPNCWSCLPSAFAMAMGVELSWLIDKLGHDGSKIIYPELNDPEARKSFNVYEILEVALENGFHVTPIVKKGKIYVKDIESDYEIREEKLFTLLCKYQGIFTGETKSGLRHAVAWDGHMIYDPNGWKYERRNFIMETFWVIGKIA